MKVRMGTPSTCRARAFGRAGGLAASVLFLTLLGLTRFTLAQEAGNQAGLVIQFGDGSLYTTCVDLGPSGQATGEEILRASGLATLIDYSSGFGGGTVCKIGNEGCAFPAEKCFCQCTMKPGDPCVYWSYFHLLDGQWRYSSQGVNSYVVKPGAVEGWAWGLGAAGVGVQPPLITFEQICSAPVQATLPPPTPTRTPLPVLTNTPIIAQPTSTPLPTDTPVPSATLAPTELPMSTSTSMPPTLASTSAPDPSTTHTITPSSTPTLKPTLPATPTAPPLATEALVPEETVTATGVERLASTEDSLSSQASSVQQVDDKPENKVNYLFFGVLVLLLVGGLIFFRTR